MMIDNKYCVVSYWVGECGETQVWIYDTEEEAVKGLEKLWKQSYESATEDEAFDDYHSFLENDCGVVAWTDGLCRNFELIMPSTKEVIN